MISIIIPVYNHKQELKKCLDSISKQTFKDYEIIIIDDGSMEKIELKDFLFLQNNLKLIHQENLGANIARNRGFKESRGDFLLFCDADIIMKYDMIEKMFNVLQKNSKISYVYSSFKFGWKKFKLWNFSASKLRKMPYIHTTSLIRRKHFPMFDESIKRLQDWDLYLSMLENRHYGIWIPEILFEIKSRNNGISKWLPSFLYKISWLKSVRDYRKAEEIIKKKHCL